jgi:hypothetical protein
MTAPTYSNPDYNPKTWALGYQQSQFGKNADPVPTGSEGKAAPYPSIYSALANPPAAMTTSVEMAIDTAPVIVPDQ